MYPENEVPASKTVDSRVPTDRQTHRQTHTHTHRQTDRQTHRQDRKHDSCPSQMGNYNKKPILLRPQIKEQNIMLKIIPFTLTAKEL